MTRKLTRARAQPRTSKALVPRQIYFVEVRPQNAAVGSVEDKRLRLTRRVIFLSRHWRNALDDALRAGKASHAQWLTLTWIELLAGKANHRELAERVGVELPTLVRLLNRMEKDGIVRRRLLVAERGAKTVVLTAKGRRALASMRGVVMQTRAGFLEKLDEQQLTQALEALDVVLSQYATVVAWEDI
jgi:MarR family transcriptional regulator for hemolysin